MNAGLVGTEHALRSWIGPVRLLGMGIAYDDLVALTHQIARDGDAISAAGIELHQWGPNQDGDAVEMLVRGEAAPAQAYVDAAYGRGRVVVRHTDDPPGVRC